MNNKRVYDIQQAINRLQNYCALQDRCQQEVLQKMQEWGLLERTQHHILELLISDNFVDEARYAKSFCRGKFRINKWGKIKITQALRSKNISENCIKLGLAEIEDSAYLHTLEELYQKQKNIVKGANWIIKQSKIVNFLLQKGFERGLIWDIINKDK